MVGSEVLTGCASDCAVAAPLAITATSTAPATSTRLAATETRPPERGLLGLIGRSSHLGLQQCQLYIAPRSRAKCEAEKPHKVFTEVVAFLTGCEQKPLGGGTARRSTYSLCAARPFSWAVRHAQAVSRTPAGVPPRPPPLRCGGPGRFS